MSSTKIPVCYSLNTGRIRWWASPDNDNEISLYSAGKGEALLLIDRTAYSNDINVLQSLVSTITGVTPSNDTYAVVSLAQIDSDGNLSVVGSLIADPDGCGDAVTNCSLIPSNQAKWGWKYNPTTKQFISPPVSAEDQALIAATKAKGLPTS